MPKKKIITEFVDIENSLQDPLLPKNKLSYKSLRFFMTLLIYINNDFILQFKNRKIFSWEYVISQPK